MHSEDVVVGQRFHTDWRLVQDPIPSGLAGWEQVVCSTPSLASEGNAPVICFHYLPPPLDRGDNMANLHIEDAPFPGDFTSSLHPYICIGWGLLQGFTWVVIIGNFVCAIWWSFSTSTHGSGAFSPGGGAFLQIFRKTKCKFPTLPWSVNKWLFHNDCRVILGYIVVTSRSPVSQQPMNAHPSSSSQSHYHYNQ